jgi:hypothetical protein
VLCSQRCLLLTMLTAFFLFEAFKEDVCADVVGLGAYAITVRRKIIDIAAKIVRRGGQVILKVTEATYKRLNLAHMWQRSNSPPRFLGLRGKRKHSSVLANRAFLGLKMTLLVPFDGILYLCRLESISNYIPNLSFAV